ncbi:MAG: extracellular solute-binding protein [Synergistaceae bacterium]|jgi:sn-glycerol 3-phosphate transport system substrate-binding protein|nr:extracellular solute-binding protein [Synergistaceae bacterium]
MRKSFVLLTAVIILALSFLAWRFSKSPDSAPVVDSSAETGRDGETVEVLFWNVFADDTSTGEFLARASEAFMKENPGVKITVNGQGGYDAIAERLEAAAAAGNLPTMAVIEETFLGRFHPIVAELSRYLPDAVIENYQPGLLASGYIGDGLYAVPFNRSMPVLFYNKTKFEAAGINSPPATWDEFRETAEAMSDRENGVRGAALCWDTDAWIFESVLYSWGGDILDETNKKVVFNDGGKAAETVRFFQEMEENGTLFSPYNHQEDPWITVATEVLQGRACMMLGSNGMYSLYSQWMADAGYELGIAMQPSFGDTPSVATGAGNIVVFGGAREEQKAAAGKFLEFLARDEYAGEYAALTGYLPVTKTAANSEKLRAWLSEKPEYQAVIEQMMYAHRRPFTKNWKNMYGVIVEELEACLSDKRADAAEAMESAAAACQKIMDENPD